MVLIGVVTGSLYYWHKHDLTVAQKTAKAFDATSNISSNAIHQSSDENPEVPTPTPNPNVPGGPENGSGLTVSSTPHPPSGTYVSNYHPSINTEEYSSCSTTPGATCTIRFKNTSTGITKQLTPVVATASKSAEDGVAEWSSWTPASIGLSAGDWQVTATATLGGNSASTASTLILDVQS